MTPQSTMVQKTGETRGHSSGQNCTAQHSPAQSSTHGYHWWPPNSMPPLPPFTFFCYSSNSLQLCPLSPFFAPFFAPLFCPSIGMLTNTSPHPSNPPNPQTALALMTLCLNAFNQISVISLIHKTCQLSSTTHIQPFIGQCQCQWPYNKCRCLVKPLKGMLLWWSNESVIKMLPFLFRPTRVAIRMRSF